MQINIKAQKARLAPEAHQIINEKIGSLTKYCDCIIKADIEVGISTRHHQKGDIYLAKANLEVPGRLLRAEAETDDIGKSMNIVREKLKLELKRYKETRD
ncbi:MAG TPA: ribosome-associated translation inhibitor RaiA [bacterium]|nr:ribosome-associated translation inhibitor RaiA [bacterium]HNS34366.1 ribosome-associated translation inhibitor RaiA [bacterium]HNW09243.1 ribosome-associated translation inhibitor RaiA [bacterium]HNZ73637.1 ribosome-associated translation inhibitor RaiA [bacterium]HOH67325.1 ribosome-associated translation inhibitor RaiA [bacterium]